MIWVLVVMFAALGIPGLAVEKDKPIKAVITYPVGEIDTIEPRLAFIAPPHNAFEAEITVLDKVIWQSGESLSRDYTVQCPPLPSDTICKARVRVRVKDAWGEWVNADFHTPETPLVKIISPNHAAHALGPDVEIKWRLEANKPARSVEVLVDGIALSGRRPLESGEHAEKAKLKAGMHRLEIRVSQDGKNAVAASDFYVWTPPQIKEEIAILDLNELRNWDVGNDPALASRMYDILQAAACLQGIVNRKGPRMVIRIYDQDDYWLTFLREPGEWLAQARFITYHAKNHPEESLLKLVEKFKSEVKGLVVWDPDVPATSNVATTVAAVEDLLPVRGGAGPEALAGMLKNSGLAVKLDLTGKFSGSGSIPDINVTSTGSAKCDAYLWAKARYLDSGRANARCLGYWLDAFWLKHSGRITWWENCLTNHDWIVKNRGFLFDLSNWGDEAPQDDPGQGLGTDLETFKSILLSAYKKADGKMIHVSGFTPWAFKYTELGTPPGKHEPVATEWEVVRILSAYNAYLDADAHGISAMANASFWTQMPVPDRYTQNTPPSPLELQKLGYMDSKGTLAPIGFTLFYVGDFDSAAWLYRQTPGLWADKSRGDVPMGWAFNPNLCERMAPALYFAYKRKTSKDYFTAGDSGAGYVNPTMLLEPRPISGLPSGEKAWTKHSRTLFRRFNQRITGFLINGHAGQITPEAVAMTATFSPDGAATQGFWMPGESHLVGNMPLAKQYWDLSSDIEASVDCMSRFRTEGLQFLNFRTILLGPSFVKDLTHAVQQRHPEAPFAMLDPYAFYYMLRHHLGGVNERRVTFTFDTLGSEREAGTSVSIKIGLRNEGWETWKAGQTFLEWGIGGAVDWRSTVCVPLTQDAAPGESVIVDIKADLPKKRGEYFFFYDMGDSRGSFRDACSPWWESKILLK